MTQGDGLVQVREIDDILNLDEGTAYRLHRQSVFYARKLKTGVWAVGERELPFVIDRILRYRSRRAFHPAENLTVQEAAEALNLSGQAIYALLARGELDAATNEHWKCATKESVNRLCRRKGLREVA